VIGVACISISPVKGFRLHHPERVELGRDGVAGNRRFVVVDNDGQRFRTSATPWLSLLAAEYDAATETLCIRFPDGTEVEGIAVAGDDRIHSTVGSLDLRGRVVDGPWAEPLTRLAGRPARLARIDTDRMSANAPVTLVSDGSLARFSAEAGVGAADPRRFRILFELAGCRPHEEDSWAGERVRIGEAVVRVGRGIGRCAVTTRDPETGERDIDSLRVLARYRGRRDDGNVVFGVYAEVEEPGVVGVGDDVALL
jgi:uncharacterized protein YcbX